MVYSGSWKEKNIALIKELYEIYKNNQTVSKTIYSIIGEHKHLYFSYLIGKVGIIIMLMSYIFYLRYRKFGFTVIIVVLSGFSYVLNFMELPYHFKYKARLSEVNKLNQNVLNVHITFYLINIWLFYIFLFFYIIFLFFSCKLEFKESFNKDNSSSHQKLIDKDSTELKMKNNNNDNNDSNNNMNSLIPDGIN